MRPLDLVTFQQHANRLTLEELNTMGTASMYSVTPIGMLFEMRNQDASIVKALEYLIQRGADPNWVCESLFSRTPVEACRNVEQLKLLVKYGAMVDANTLCTILQCGFHDALDNTPVDEAVQFLLDLGVNPWYGYDREHGFRCYNNWRALEIALDLDITQRPGMPRAIDLLRNKEQELLLKEIRQLIAGWTGQVGIAKLILQCAYDPNPVGVKQRMEERIFNDHGWPLLGTPIRNRDPDLYTRALWPSEMMD